jgi:V/A-type H+-transporting ATPase subunit E
MQNKLQELTDKLYNEGLSKGKQEAEQMMANAKNEAAQIIAQAKEQAQEILAKAQNDAAELKSKTENDVKMASLQAFTAVKQQIESVITAKTLAPAKSAVAETEFLKEIVKAIVTAFNPQNSDSVALDIILPAEKQAELEQFAKEQLSKICSAGVDVQFSKGVQGGFKIAPKGEGYMLSFTDKDFENIIAEYLRPKTKELLFG